MKVAETRRTYQPRTTTRAIVRLHSDDFPGGRPLEFTPKGQRGDLDGKMPPLSGSLIGVTTRKQIGAASGYFQVTLKRDPRGGSESLLRLIEDPEDVWVEIIFVCDGQLIYTWLGLVDTIKENVTRKPDGSRNETYVITGQDVGKVFDRTDIFVNLFEKNGGVKQYVKVYDAASKRIVGNPADFTNFLLDTWVHNNDVSAQPWILPKSLTGSRVPFSAILKRFMIQDMGPENGLLQDPTLLQPSTSGTNLWAMLEEYSNPMMNELWVDLVPAATVASTTGGGLLGQIGGQVSQLGGNAITGGKGAPLDAHRQDRLRNGTAGRFNRLPPAITLRERPFPTSKGGKKRWDSLRLHRLRLGDIKMREIAKGGPANRYNYWLPELTGLGGSAWDSQAFIEASTIDGARQGNPGDIPIVDQESIDRHGLRRWMQSTKYVPLLNYDNDDVKLPGKPTTALIADLVANWLRKCHDWYVIAPYELSGTLITSRVFPEIRIGERVLEDRNGEPPIMYYVEEVSHEWQYPGPGQTTLLVTRGEYEDQHLLGKVYERYRQGAARRDTGLPSSSDLIEDGLSAMAEAQKLTNKSIPEIDVVLTEDGFDRDDAEAVRGSKFTDEEMKPYPTTDIETLQARRLASGDPTARVMPPSIPMSPATIDADALETGLDFAIGSGSEFDDTEVT